MNSPRRRNTNPDSLLFLRSPPSFRVAQLTKTRLNALRETGSHHHRARQRSLPPKPPNGMLTQLALTGPNHSRSDRNPRYRTAMLRKRRACWSCGAHDSFRYLISQVYVVIRSSNFLIRAIQGCGTGQDGTDQRTCTTHRRYPLFGPP
jgi:hypothetical protein